MKKFLLVILVLAVALAGAAVVIATRNSQRHSLRNAPPAVQTRPAAESEREVHAVQAFDAWQIGIKLDAQTDYRADAAAKERLRKRLSRDPGTSPSMEERK